MKHLIVPLFTFTFILHLFALSAFAAVPLRWTVETSAANPATFDQFAGATYDLEAALQSRGKPLALDGEAQLFWQTNGMGSAWWTAPATVSGNVLRATWTPACDVGAKVYNCFIGITGTVYNAAFQLRLRPSPGAVPNIIDVPPRVLDLAHTVVINPPWPTDATIDASIRRVIDEDGITAPAPTNTVKGIISNTVDKAYVESLGISGGGSGGTNTNDVKAIVEPMIAESTNGIPERIAALQDGKRDKTDLALYTNVFSRFTWTSDDPNRSQEIIDALNEIEDNQPYWLDQTKEGGPKRWVTPFNLPEIDLPDLQYHFEGSDDTSPYDAEVVTFTLVNHLPGNLPEFRVQAVRSRTVQPASDTLALASQLPEANQLLTSEQRAALDVLPGDVDEAKSAANEANVLSASVYNFMTGGRTNCWFSGTNYVFGADAATRTRFAWKDGMDDATVPCSMALWEIRDGVRQLVWDQRDWTAWYWSFKSAQMTADIQGRIDALGNAVTNASNYAWAKRYASDGTPNPDASTTFIDTPSVTLSPGMKWETVATVYGASYWTIVGNGAVIGGSGTNATLRIMDFEGNDIMTVTKGEHRLAWLERGDITGLMTDGNGWICFDMLADAEPVGYFSTTLDSSDFLPQTDPNCPAQYSWENIGGGKWRVHFLLKPGIQSNACFAKFQVEVEGQTVIRYNAGQDISGGLIYNGVKIAPDVSGSPAVGTVIQWKVVH